MTEHVADIRYIVPVLRVEDLNRALAFYRDLLGFGVEFVYEGSYAEICRDGCRIHLHCSAPTPRDQVAFEHAEHIDICVVVRDADHLAASVASAGADFVVPLRSMPYGKEFYIRDPDNYVLGFVEPAR